MEREHKTGALGCPNILCHKCGERAANVDGELVGGDGDRIEIPVLSHRIIGIPVCNVFTEKPKGSNSIDTLLLVVKRLIESKFLMRFGACSTLGKCNGGCGGERNFLSTANNYISIIAHIKIRRESTSRRCPMGCNANVHIPVLIANIKGHYMHCHFSVKGHIAQRSRYVNTIGSLWASAKNS